MYLDDIKHLTWLCRVDYKVYFVVLIFMNVMNLNNTRFYVNLTPFLLHVFCIQFLNQRELILATQDILQSV